MASPKKGKRPSLIELFENLEIPSSPSSTSSSPTRRTKMMKNLRASISKGWPSQKESLSLTIRSDDVYRQYAQDQDPKKLFEQATNWISTIQDTAMDEAQQDLVAKELNDAIIRAIFGSNMIERAGLGWDITVQLCRKVFAGEPLDEIPERSSSYQDELLGLYQRDPSLRDMPAQYVLRGRNEIIQHAKAFQYLLHAFVVQKEDLNEDLIKKTHKILTKNVPIVDEDMPEVPPEKYGGIYRAVVVGAGTTNFTVPQFVPKKMKEMCDNLTKELAEAETSCAIDPFSVAAKYSLEFVQIHPFQDGNGRMCRMILNAILCRYAGVVIPIGEQGEEREEYMGIKRRASTEMEGHGEYATFVLQRSVRRLRELKKKLAGKGKGKGKQGAKE